jgi:hypothetical protein
MSEKKTKKLRQDVARKTGRTLMKKGMRRLRAAYRATPGAARADFDVQPIVGSFVREDVARAMQIVQGRRDAAAQKFAEEKRGSKLKRAFKKIFGSKR